VLRVDAERAAVVAECEIELAGLAVRVAEAAPSLGELRVLAVEAPDDLKLDVVMRELVVRFASSLRGRTVELIKLVSGRLTEFLQGILDVAEGRSLDFLGCHIGAFVRFNNFVDRVPCSLNYFLRGVQANPILQRVDGNQCTSFLHLTIQRFDLKTCGFIDKIRKERFALSELLVICDDLALPFGKIRIRAKGSAGGHNGLKSIIEHTESSEFSRVRLGILPELGVSDAAEYVLSPISEEFQRLALTMVEQAGKAVVMIGQQGLLPAMNYFNSLSLPEKIEEA
jgi:hypothetical protein